jgi:GT2 family glycosyltransferase
LEELLLGAAEHPNALIASKILSAEESWIVWSMGGRFDVRRGRLDMMACGQFDDGRWEEPRFADWLPGMSVLVPMDLFRRGVWVDAHAFPQYSGDSDFTLRARQAGFDLVVWPRSRVYNKVKSSGLTSRLLLGLESFSLKLLIESLISIRSSAAFNTFGKLVLRHSPFYTWPITLGRFYGFYFLKCLQVWLKLPRLRRRALLRDGEAPMGMPQRTLVPEDKPELISLDL